MSKARTAWLTGAALVALALAAAGCGTAPAATRSASGDPPGGITAPGLASSLAVADGASWAVVEMGGSAAQHNNFWELFVRPSREHGLEACHPSGRRQ